MHYLPSFCSHFKSWFESDCHPSPHFPSCSAGDKAAPAQHSWWRLFQQTAWLHGNQLRLTFLYCSTKTRKHQTWWVPLQAAIPFHPNPPCISPNACVMNLPLFLMRDNLSTQAYLRGVVDLFILNTNATFWVIFLEHELVCGTRHLPGG